MHVVNNEHCEKITSSAQILALLNRIKEARTTTQLQVDQSAQFNSIIVSINEKSLLLEKVRPEEGNEVFSQGMKFQVSTKIQGIELNFVSNVIEKLEDNSIRVELPKEVDYLQRRAHQRVYFGQNYKPKVTLTTDKGALSGYAENISLGGIRLIFENQEQLFLEPGEILSKFTVQLGPSIHIICKIDVRDCQYDMESRKLSIGAQFRYLSKSQENTLSRYIVNIEREAKRNL